MTLGEQSVGGVVHAVTTEILRGFSSLVLRLNFDICKDFTAVLYKFQKSAKLNLYNPHTHLFNTALNSTNYFHDRRFKNRLKFRKHFELWKQISSEHTVFHAVLHIFGLFKIL
jgi:hypothetical protein